MNRYRKAYERLKNKEYHYLSMDKVYEDIYVLGELVELATPTKPVDIQTPLVTWGLCPNCRGEMNKLAGKPNRLLIGTRYCPDCGQRLDWSDVKE